VYEITFNKINTNNYECISSVFDMGFTLLKENDIESKYYTCKILIFTNKNNYNLFDTNTNLDLNFYSVDLDFVNSTVKINIYLDAELIDYKYKNLWFKCLSNNYYGCFINCYTNYFEPIPPPPPPPPPATVTFPLFNDDVHTDGQVMKGFFYWQSNYVTSSYNQDGENTGVDQWLADYVTSAQVLSTAMNYPESGGNPAPLEVTNLVPYYKPTETMPLPKSLYYAKTQSDDPVIPSGTNFIALFTGYSHAGLNLQNMYAYEPLLIIHYTQYLLCR
jgi:hypothetical protein